jgi:hypothetical protein
MHAMVEEGSGGQPLYPIEVYCNIPLLANPN